MDKTTEKKSEASENWLWRLQLSGSVRDQKVERGLCWPPDRRHEEKPRAWPAHRLAGPGPRLDLTNRAAETEREEGPKKTNRAGSVWQEITEENKMEKPAACLDLRKGKNRAVTRATDRSRTRWCRQKNQILERETRLWVRTWLDRKQSRAAKNDGGEVSAVKRKPGAPSARTELEALTDKTKLGGGQGVLSTTCSARAQNAGIKSTQATQENHFCWSTNLPTTNTGEVWSTNRSNRLYLAQ
jgi:hypothetical protein